MKIIGNIGPFCAIARSVLVLGEHKKIIDNLKAQGKKDEERKAIAEVCDVWSKTLQIILISK